MQTGFTPDQLADHQTATSEAVLRKCVHCGFCTATCPTFVLLGDERDSPRGRIYMIREMLEGHTPVTKKTVTHIDRCLSCLSCMSTCPSGVNYMHLIDHARQYIESHYRRPIADRLMRAALAFTLPSPRRFHVAFFLARLFSPLAPLLRRAGRLGRQTAVMLELARPAPRRAAPQPASPLPSPASAKQENGEGAPGEKNFADVGRGKKITFFSGCVQPSLRPSINEASERLFRRLGFSILDPLPTGCCGALTLHMGKAAPAKKSAMANITLWWRLLERKALDAIIVTASGCGTAIKHYPALFEDNPLWHSRAKIVADHCFDVSQYLAGFDITPPPGPASGLRVAYQSACSLQHGQRVDNAPRRLLANAGYRVENIAEGHLCCGSAGVYNILQVDIAGRLKARKLENIARTDAQILASGNIGCITQLQNDCPIPVIHTVELLDWAYGGPLPDQWATDQHARSQ